MRLWLPLLATSILTACSSTEYNYQPQYCYTDQTITMQNKETVNSETTLQCTDRPGQQVYMQRAGVDKGCSEFFYTEYRNGKANKQRGVQCEKPDGTWEVLDLNGFVR